MSPLPNIGWLVRILEYEGAKTASIAGACGFILIALDYGWFSLPDHHETVRATVFITGVVFAFLTLPGLLKWSGRTFWNVVGFFEAEKRNEEIISLLDEISGPQRELLAWLVQANVGRFVTSDSFPPADLLVEKDLMSRQLINRDSIIVPAWRYEVYSHVWTALIRKKAEFKLENLQANAPWE